MVTATSLDWLTRSIYVRIHCVDRVTLYSLTCESTSSVLCCPLGACFRHLIRLYDDAWWWRSINSPSASKSWYRIDGDWFEKVAFILSLSLSLYPPLCAYFLHMLAFPLSSGRPNDLITSELIQSIALVCRNLQTESQHIAIWREEKAHRSIGLRSFIYSPPHKRSSNHLLAILVQ